MRTLRSIEALVVIPGLALWLTGCGGQQSPLNPNGIEAEHLARLFWFFTAACAAVWGLVLIGLLAALYASRRRNDPISDPLMLDANRERRMIYVVASLVGLTTIILIVFTFSSYLATKTLAASGEALKIEVTGYQWWWNVNYENPEPSQIFATANELHVPVGQPVKIDLKAADVIHSFWVPNLTGKQDLIPGQENVVSFTAQRVGTYRGQCAEFCGWQHAHMAFFVVAEQPTAFAAWRANQLAASTQPADEEAKLGKQIFLTRGCALCHTIRGTNAGGKSGPDLTHVASRLTLAAGTLPNSRGKLVEWIADPQKFKPGNKMPKVPLTQMELDALGVYLWKQK